MTLNLVALLIPQGQLLASSHSIARLNLAFNDITAAGCDTLARSLLTNTSLTALNLSYNPIGDEGCYGLSEWIKGSSVIREFHVDHCRISDDGIGALVDALSVTASPIASLDLGGNRFGTEAVLGIWSLVPVLPQLEYLAVRACDIRPAEVAELAPLLPHASSLRTLGEYRENERLFLIFRSSDLRGNKIADRGATLLAQQLPNTNLATVDLHKNVIGQPGVQALAAALCMNTSVTSLVLSDNKVSDGDAALAEIEQHLRKNSLIAELRLQVHAPTTPEPARPNGPDGVALAAGVLIGATLAYFLFALRRSKL